MKPHDYYNHVDEEFLDYYSPAAEKRRKRAIAELNGERPGISPRLRKIVLFVIVAFLIMLIGKLLLG